MLTSTMLASISIWLWFLHKPVKIRPKAILLAFASPPENTQLFLWSSYFSYSHMFQYSFQPMTGSVYWVTNKVARSCTLMSKHLKAVEALDLQAETKLNVYKLRYIELQAPEINYTSLIVTQKLQCITSCTDVTRYLNTFSS